MKKSRTTRSHFTQARSFVTRSIDFLRVRNDRLPSGRILCEKEIFSIPLIVIRVTRKVTKTNLGEFYRSHVHHLLKCNKIYLLFSSLSDLDSFCWRVHLSYGVWIYILIIKVNKLVSFFSSRCFLKGIENMYSVFLRVIQTLVEVWENSNFSFSQTSTRVCITR